MKIKRFNESEVSDLSTDRVLEITNSISDMISTLDQKSEFIDSLINELNNFRSSSTSKNDQIDDSVSNLELAKKYVLDLLDKLDSVSQNMKDYNQNVRKYLY